MRWRLIVGGIVSDDYEGTTLDSIVLMAASGIGVAILPELFTRRQAVFRDEVTVRPLQIANANRDIALLARGQDTLGAGHDMLISALHGAAQTLGLALRGIER